MGQVENAVGCEVQRQAQMEVASIPALECYQAAWVVAETRL